MKISQASSQPTGLSAPAPSQLVAAEYRRIAELAKALKFDEAEKAARALVAAYPESAAANFALAIVLSDQSKEKKPDALEYAERALKLDPANPGYMIFLGKLYVDLELLELAPALLIRAFSLDKRLYQAPLALASYFVGAGKGEKAIGYFESAIAAAPPDARDAIRANMADCLVSLGRLEEADQIYRQLAERSQLMVHSLCRRAMLNKNGVDSVIFAELQQALQRPDISESDRVSTHLALGRLQENSGDYASAFQNYAMAKRLLPNSYDPDGFAALVADSIEAYVPEVFTRFKAWGHASNKPIFVVGMPRSGTTMLEQIIAAHSRASGVGELTRTRRLFDGLSRGRGAKGIFEQMAKAGPARWKEIPENYLHLLEAMAPGAERVVDKLPHNFLHLGFIHHCFPSARILHIKRHPADNFISAFQNDMSSLHGYSFDQESYARYYRLYEQLMGHWLAIMPDAILDVSYEALTANPEAQISNILKFLDLPWEDGCLNFHQNLSTVRTFSRLQVRNPINTRSVGRWRNYEEQLGPLMKILDLS